jgi:hypothetical protein
MGLLSKAAVIKTAGPGTPIEDFEQNLEKYFSAGKSMQGIVFEAPPGFKKGKVSEDFDAVVGRIIAMLGSVLPLPSGRILTIFSDTADLELIAHRLEKTVDAKALALFAAEEPSKVLEYIGPYL